MKKISAKKTSSGAPKKRSLTKDIIRDYQLYIMLIPAFLIAFGLMKYGPMYGLIIAFKDFNLVDGVWGSPWVGLQHFQRLFASPDFLLILRNTILLSLYSFIFNFPAPIIIALMLNEMRQKNFKRTLQSFLYVPHFISWVVLGGIAIDILSPSSGIVNGILKTLGMEPIYFLASNFWWPIIYVITAIWKEAGWGTIIYMSALSSIDPQQYEAAEIDGAGRFRKMWSITLPGIKGTAAVLLIMNMGKIMNMGFDQVYMLQNPAVRQVSDIIATYVYRQGLQGMQYSYTTALGLFQSVVGLIMVIITNTICKKMGESGLW